VVQPTVTDDGQKAPGLRFGDPRVMALLLALTVFTHLLHGFRNHDLRALVTDLLGPASGPYRATQASYDLRRLCRKGIVFKEPGTNRYVVTPYGWKLSRLFARLDARVFRPAHRALLPDGVTDPQPQLSAPPSRVDRQLDLLLAQAFPARTVA
jgi:hypothetical protein